MRLLIITIIAICLYSCGSNNTPAKNTTEPVANGTTGATTGGDKPTAAGANNNWQQLQMVAFKDNKGNVIAEAPYPPDWKMMSIRNQGDASITGPHNIKVVDFNLKSFMYTNDPQLQQVYYQSGQPLRPWPGVDAVIEQDIKPRGEAQGLKFVKHYEIPEITKIDKWYNDQLYKAVPSKTDVVAVGTDWQMADGTPYFLLVHINVSTTANMQNWSFYTSGLSADKDYFNRAKKQYIFSLSNTRYALGPIMEYNQAEAQKAGQSWQAFNQRMAQNQAAFEAQQRAHINKTEAINNAIMSGWRASNAASDKNQEQFVDAINEHTKVQNTETGQNYKVESHYNQYWMNKDGEYISTNLNNYNPNLDENMNNQKWQELKQVPY